MGVNMWQLVLVLLIVILLFGRGRIPALMGDVAAGIRSFKQGMQDEEAAPPAQEKVEQQHNPPSEQLASKEQKNA